MLFSAYFRNIFMLILALFFIACSHESTPKNVKKYSFKALNLEGLNENPQKIEIKSNGYVLEFFINGKVIDSPIFLAFVSSKCDLCKNYIPTLNNLVKKHTNVRFIGILTDNGDFDSDLALNVAPKFLLLRANDDKNLLLALSKSLDVKTIGETKQTKQKEQKEPQEAEIKDGIKNPELPLFIIYDSNHNQADFYQGYIPEEMLDFEIKNL